MCNARGDFIDLLLPIPTYTYTFSHEIITKTKKKFGGKMNAEQKKKKMNKHPNWWNW